MYIFLTKSYYLNEIPIYKIEIQNDCINIFIDFINIF